MKLTKKQRKFLAGTVSTTIAATAATSALIPSELMGKVSAEEYKFHDVSQSNYAYQEILYLVSKGIIKGYRDGTFRPNHPITREQVAILFSRSFKLESSTYQGFFHDIPETNKWASMVESTKDAGIFTGDQGYFYPEQYLTREQMASVIVRAFQLEKLNDVPVKLNDLQKVSQDHRKNVEILYQHGITTGKEDGRFAPKDEVTRAQFALFLHRALHMEKPQVIEDISNGDITINGKRYEVSSTLQGLINEKNAAQLLGATIKFQHQSNTIEEINFLELHSSESNPLDAGGAQINGDLLLNGAITSISNIHIKGKLTIAESNQAKEISFEKITVEQAATFNNGATVTIRDSILSDIFITQQENNIELKGTSKTGQLTITGDSTITVDETSNLSSILVKGKAEKLELKGNAGKIVLNNETDLVITGKGDIEDVTIATDSNVDLGIQGVINRLSLQGKGTVILHKDANVNETTLAEGVSESQIQGNTPQKTSKTSGGGSSSRSSSNNQNPLTEGKTYNENIKINPKAGQEYGSNTRGREAVVNGDVTIQGNLSGSATLKNVVIHGTLILDPGDKGSIILDNVKADQIQIISGKNGTVHLNSVNADSVTVTDGITLDTDGTSIINHIKISPAHSEYANIVLQGNFNDAKLELSNGVKLTANKGFAAKELIVDAKDQHQEVELISGSGDFSELKNITVKNAAKINTVGKTKISQVNIAVKQAGQEVSLNGELDEARVVVSKPVALYVGASIHTLQAAADVSIDGEPEKVKDIQVFEKAEGAKITPATAIMEELFAVIERQMVLNAVEAIQNLPAQVSIKDIHSIQNAMVLVNNALAFGADKNDFIIENVDYYASIIEIQSKITKVMDALIEVKKALQSLTGTPDNIQAIGLEGLQEQIDAVESAITAAVEAGVQEADLKKVDHYQRLEPAKLRKEALTLERTEALDNANSKVQKLPSSEEISFANFIDSKNKLTDAKAAVSEAEAKGVQFEDLSSLESVEEKVSQLEEEKSAAIEDVNQKISSLPKVSDLDFNNQDEVKSVLTELEELIQTAYDKTAVDEDFAELAKVEGIKNRLDELVQEKLEAIATVNEALAALPNPESLQPLDVTKAEQQLHNLQALIEDAKAKTAVDDDFIGLKNITPLEDKISELNELKKQAITAAEDKINLIPAASEITYETLATAKEKVKAAVTAVESAKAAGAQNAEISNLPILQEAQIKIETLEKEKQQSIKKANDLLASLPAFDDVTDENVETIKQLVEDTKKAIDDAKTKGASDEDIQRLDYLAELEEFLTGSLEERKSAIAEVNKALSLIPGTEEINVDNYQEVENLLLDAGKRIEEALALGAILSDFTGYDLYLAAQIKVETLEMSKAEAVKKANEILASIPSSADITLKNKAEVEAIIKSYYIAYDAAVEKGANPSDFHANDALKAAEVKIQELTESLAGAIEAANIAIDKIPAPSEITLTNFRTVKVDVDAANAAVDEARSKGASDDEFTGLEKLTEVQEKVEEYMTAMNAAIKKAVDALNALPAPSEITNQNAADAEAKVDQAENLVKEARNAGAVDSDLKGLSKLTAVKEKLKELSNPPEGALAKAQAALQAVLELGEVNENNYEEAHTTYLQAYLAIANAKAAGAVESDFDQEALAVYDTLLEKINPFMPERPQFEDPLEALARINEDLTLFTEEDFQLASDYYYDSDKLEEYRAELKKRRAEGHGHFTLRDIQHVVESVDNQETDSTRDEALALLNEDPANMSRELLREIAWFFDELFDELKEELVAAVSEGELSLQEVRELIYEKNEEYALRYINDHSDSFEMQHLSWALTYSYNVNLNHDLEEEYKTAISVAVNNNGGSITQQELYDLVNRIEADALEKFLAEVNADLPNVTRDQFDPFFYVHPWNYPQFIRELVYKKANEQRMLNINDLHEAVSLASYASAIEHIQNHPATFDMSALYDLDLHDAEFVLLKQYREAMSQAVNSEGELTYGRIEAIIASVNKNVVNAAVTAINANPSGFSFSDISAISWEALYEYLAEYRSAVVAETEDGTKSISAQKIRDMVLNVNKNIVLVRINENPEGLTHDDLREATGRWVEPSLFPYYKNAILEKWNETQEPFTRDSLIEIIDEVQSNLEEIALAEINANPAGFTWETLLQAGLNGEERYLDEYRSEVQRLKAELDRDLNYDDLVQVIQAVQQKEKIQFVNDHPTTFERHDFIEATNRHVSEMVLPYLREAIYEALQSKGSDLTKGEMISILDEVNSNMDASIIQAINEDPLNAKIEHLEYIAGNVSVEYLKEYQQALLDQYSQNGPLDRWDIQETIQFVNSSKLLDLLNQDISLLDVYDFYELVNVGVYEEYYSHYVNEITNHPKYGYLTLSDVEGIFEKVNQEGSLQFIINHSTTFEDHHLANIIGWELVIYDFMDDYRNALTGYLGTQDEISVEELQYLVQEVNDDAWLSQINHSDFINNPMLYHLFEHDFENVYDFVLWEFELEYSAAIMEARGESGELTKDEIQQIIQGINDSKYGNEQDLNELITSVENLFNHNNMNWFLKEGVTEEEVGILSASVESLSDDLAVKSELQEQIEAAYFFLSPEWVEAKAAYDSLFDESEKLLETVTVEEITKVEEMVAAIETDFIFPDRLLATLESRKDGLVSKVAREAVYALYVQNGFDEDGDVIIGDLLKDGVTIEDVNVASAVVNALPEGNSKRSLNSLIDKAYLLLTPEGEAASALVTGLFDPFKRLHPHITAEYIQDAAEKVAVLPNSRLKSEYQSNIQDAWQKLEAREAVNAVESLFKPFEEFPDEYRIIRDDLTLEEFQQAKQLHQQLPSTNNIRYNLEWKLTIAEEQLSKREFSTVLSETAKYEDTATIGTDIAEGTDVTDLIIKLKDDFVASDTVEIAVVSDDETIIAVSTTEDISSETTSMDTDMKENAPIVISAQGYFEMNQENGRIYLAEENNQEAAVEDTIVLQFTSDHGVEYLKIKVTIQGEALTLEQVEDVVDEPTGGSGGIDDSVQSPPAPVEEEQTPVEEGTKEDPVTETEDESSEVVEEENDSNSDEEDPITDPVEETDEDQAPA